MNAYQFSLAQNFSLCLGIFLGLVISGILKTVLHFLASRFERPEKVRYGNLNGRLENGTDFEVLYLFERAYYTKDQYDFLLKQRLEDVRSVTRLSPVMIFLTVCLVGWIITLVVLIQRLFGF